MDFKETLYCSPKTICQSCGKVVAPQESNPANTHFFLPFSTLCSCRAASLIPAPKVWQAIQYSKDVFVRDDFELVEALGTGTLAYAYRVKSKALDKDFVIKILDEKLAENPRTAKRYRLAAAAALNLSHANLAHVVESGINEAGASYVVTEYIDGQDLASVLKNEGFLDPADVIELGVQILEALDHAHQNNVMHRGVKPSNIFLCDKINGKFKVKLADIGIARAWPSGGRETRFLLLDGSEFGDPRYLSPEQLSGQTFKPSSDIYSLGCVLYEAISGKTPFNSGSRTKIAIKQLTEEARGLSERFRDLDIPYDLEAVIMKALAKEQKDRYQSAREMLEDLQKVGKPSGPKAVHKHKAQKDKEGLLPKLLRMTKGNSLLVTVALVGLIGYLFAAGWIASNQLDALYKLDHSKKMEASNNWYRRAPHLNLETKPIMTAEPFRAIGHRFTLTEENDHHTNFLEWNHGQVQLSTYDTEENQRMRDIRFRQNKLNDTDLFNDALQYSARTDEPPNFDPTGIQIEESSSPKSAATQIF